MIRVDLDPRKRFIYMKMLQQHYLKEFERMGVHTSEKWAQQQKFALQGFLDQEFLNIKDEKWRYIIRSPFLQQPFKVGSLSTRVKVEAVERSLPPPKQPHTLRFICLNGRFYLPMSKTLPVGLKVEPITYIMQENPEMLMAEKWDKSMQLGHSFNRLNTLFSQEGLNITVRDNCKIEPTLEIWYVSHALKKEKEPRMFCARHHVEVGKNSTVKLIECAISLQSDKQVTAPFLCTNTLTTINLQSAAEVSWAQSINILDHQSHISQLAVQQQKDSAFRSESLLLGGGLMRHTLSVDLCEPSAVCEMRGLTAVKRQHQVDHQLFVNHKADHTKSHIHYRTIADDRGKASFGGEVSAQKGIHQMSSHQGNYNLLLSDDAEIDTRPRLAL